MISPAETSVRHLSGLQLETVRLGLASAGESAAAERHLAECRRCTDLATSLEQARGEFVSDVLPRGRAALATALERRRWWRRWLPSLVLIPVTASLLVLLPLRGPSRTSPEQSVVGDLAIKGGLTLVIAARRGDRIFQPQPDDPVRAGDQIRFVLRGASLPHGLVASVDGSGRPSIYFPYEGHQSAPLASGGQVEIEGSIVLDDSPGPERIFALLSRAPLSAEDVRSALAALGAQGAAAIRAARQLDFPETEQSSVLLEKEAP